MNNEGIGKGELLTCACGRHAEPQTIPAYARRIKEAIKRHCPRDSGREALAYIEELEALWRYSQRQGNVWRGIASAMGYEPLAHNQVKPKSAWLLERIARFRASAALQPVETNEEDGHA